MKNEIFFRRRNKIFLEKGTALEPEKEYIVTMMKNIEILGFCFSSHLLEILCTYSVSQIEKFYLEIVPILKKAIGAHVSYHPMYPNFPEQVMEMSEVALYWNAIFHYMSAGTYFPGSEKKERLPFLEKTEMRQINFGTEEEFYTIFTNLMQSKTSISETDKEDLIWFFKNNPNYFYYLPKEIPMKENIAFITKLYLENTPICSAQYIRKYYKTATDVLRLVTALSGGDISLAKKGKFRSFKRAERRFILDLLENCNTIEADMNLYRERWIRIGERLHPQEYLGYEKTKKAFDKIRNKKKIYSFGGSIEKAMQQSDYEKVSILLSQRPGEFARRLDSILRQAIVVEEEKIVLKEFDKIAEEVSSPVLLQVREHFKNRGENQSSIRVFFPKGIIAKAQCIENNLDPLPARVCDTVIESCEKALISIYSKRKEMGRVYIQPEFKNYLIPFSQRSAGKSFRTIVRGSRIPLEKETRVIRTFLWWKNGEERTDLDLSAVMFDENWNYMEHISFTNLKSSRYQACHSGDIVDAPQGASEFIDVDISSLAKYGCRYLVFSVLSYTRQKFSELPECFMGFMTRKKVKSGEIYEPKIVKNKIDITAQAQMAVPILFDIKEKQYIWTDLSVKINQAWYNTVEANQNSIICACRSMAEIKKPNLYDLIYFNAKARGEIWNQKEGADVIFDLEEGITPYDLDIISCEYL